MIKASILETTESSTFGGRPFDNAGQYEQLTGYAIGVVDPADPRPSIEDRYAGNEDYVAQLRHVCETMIDNRLLLPAARQAHHHCR